MVSVEGGGGRVQQKHSDGGGADDDDETGMSAWCESGLHKIQS